MVISLCSSPRSSRKRQEVASVQKRWETRVLTRSKGKRILWILCRNKQRGSHLIPVGTSVKCGWVLSISRHAQVICTALMIDLRWGLCGFMQSPFAILLLVLIASLGEKNGSALDFCPPCLWGLSRAQSLSVSVQRGQQGEETSVQPLALQLWPLPCPWVSFSCLGLGKEGDKTLLLWQSSCGEDPLRDTPNLVEILMKYKKGRGCTNKCVDLGPWRFVLIALVTLTWEKKSPANCLFLSCFSPTLIGKSEHIALTCNFSWILFPIKLCDKKEISQIFLR